MNKFTQLIDKYLAGQMNAAEKAEFEKQVNANQQLKAELELQRQVMQGVERYGMRQSAQKGFKKASFKSKALKWGFALAVTAAVCAVAWVAKDKLGAQQNNVRYELNEEGKKQWADADKNLAPQLFEIDAAQDTVIETQGGLVVAIPANAFAGAQGKIEVEVKEALSPADIMKAGLSTTSNGKLLETGGMFYINARQQGTNLKVAEGKSINVNVPTDQKKEGMMLFDGKRLDNGQINWVNPQSLENNLSTVDITSLNFYPPNFLDSVKSFGFDIKNKKLTDSIYYSLECFTESDRIRPEPAEAGKADTSAFDDPEITAIVNAAIEADSISKAVSLSDKLKSGSIHSSGSARTIFKQNCAVCHTLTDKAGTGPGLKGVIERVPSRQWLFDYIKNNEKVHRSGDAYAASLRKKWGHAMTVFEGTLSDEDIKAVIAFIENPPNIPKSEISPCEIAPSRIRAIWNEKYNNTLLATYQFEERLQVIFGTCNAGILDLYVNNLNRKMYELDEMAAQMSGGNSQQKFREFAGHRDGGVRIDAAHLKKLQAYFEEKRKLYHEATAAALQKMYDQEGKQTAEAIKRGMEHDNKEAQRQWELLGEEVSANMKEAYRQLGKDKIQTRPPAPDYYSAPVTTLGWKNVDAFVVEATMTRTTLDYTDPTTGNKAVIKYEPLVVTVTQSEKYERVYAYLLPKELSSFQRINAVSTGTFRENLNETFHYDLVVLGFKGNDIYFKQLPDVKPGEKSVSLDASSQLDADQLLKSYNLLHSDTDFGNELRYLALEQKENIRQQAVAKREEITWKLRQVVFPCMIWEQK